MTRQPPTRVRTEGSRRARRTLRGFAATCSLLAALVGTTGLLGARAVSRPSASSQVDVWAADSRPALIALGAGNWGGVVVLKGSGDTHAARR